MKASVLVGISLDGFMARANGDLDFLPPRGDLTVAASMAAAWLYQKAREPSASELWET